MQSEHGEIPRMNSVSVASADGFSTVEFFGLSLQPRTMDELTEIVDQGIREGQKWIISNHNLHSVYLFHRHAKMREFYSQVHWTYVDGMPLIALARLYGFPLTRDQRVTGADWTWPLMELAVARGWRVFHLGSPQPVAEEAARRLRRLYPSLQLEVSDGFFDATRGSAENEALLRRINTYQPDLLVVGMGMPRQEFWTQENFARLNARVILSSNGAAFDCVAGAVPFPPRWSGRLGLEWLFRFYHEPRRLFSRYVIEPWYVLAVLLVDYSRTRLTGKIRSGKAAHAKSRRENLWAQKLWERPEAGYAASAEPPIHGD
jgi:N-acetylglucosaminyldiphosphoundecaprenol N-acetyl-beta-D-mannosaminyltransferase